MNNLLGKKFGKAEELKEAVRDDLHKISPVELKKVFNNWILRVDMCISNAGDYVDW